MAIDPSQLDPRAGLPPNAQEDSGVSSGLRQTGMGDPDMATKPLSSFNAEPNFSTNIPSFLSFDRVFESSYPDAPPELVGLARELVSALDFVHREPRSSGGITYNWTAQNYDYGQFLRDLAVASVAKGHTVKKKAEQKPEPKPVADGRKVQ